MRTRFSTSELVATVAAVSTSLIQGTNGFGFATSDQLVTAITALNSLITMAKSKGLMSS